MPITTVNNTGTSPRVASNKKNNKNDNKVPSNKEDNKKSDKDVKDEKGIIEKSMESTSTKTSRGTKIVKKGQGLDKNAFFKILSAELSNQNPTDAKDGTEYVSQMAQFSSLEQMANLNSMMKLTGASSFIGKAVLLRKLDPMGNQYAGIVRNVIKNGDDISLSVEYEPGKTENFGMEDVVNITDDINQTSNYNNNLLQAVAIIGKEVEMYDGKETKTGIVKSVSRNGAGVSIKVVVKEDGEDKEMNVPFEYVTKVKNS